METKVNSFSTYSNPGEKLIDACRRFDQKAQLQVYRMYYKTIFSFTLQISDNALRAEEIMQEAFLIAFEEIEKYNTETSFVAWLLGILNNKALSGD
jgi:DNA-directed RNA polymerase specialized sigma24 family protein